MGLWLRGQPDREPWVAYYRSDRRGGLHTSIGVELLRAHGHPDAELGQRTDTPSVGLTHKRLTRLK